MKKAWCLFLIFSVLGCASANIPKYIGDNHPYKKIFLASFDEVSKAAHQTLNELTWKVAEEVDPSVYERENNLQGHVGSQTLIFSERRQGLAFLGLKNQRVNIYVRTLADASVEVEIRYLTETSIPFKTFHNYRKDKTAERMFESIEKQLK